MNKSDSEIWKPYPEFWFVEVSNLSRVRTLGRVVSDGKGGKRFVRGRILKQNRLTTGYLEVTFSMNGKTVHRKVHRLVAKTFIPNPNNLPEINHKDNNPLNNNVSNLEWCTREYNMAYKEKCGVSAKEAAQKSQVYAVNLKTKKVSWFESQHEASRVLEVNYGNINSVIKGNRKQAGGYWFTYDDNKAVETTRSKFGDKVACKVEQLMSEKDYN